MKTVLFVCIHNSGRSQMAEAYFNQLAGEKAKGVSAGTNPAISVNPVVVEVMKEVHLDISGNKLEKLPESITNLTNLEFLTLIHNRLTSVPTPIKVWIDNNSYESNWEDLQDGLTGGK